MLKPNQSCPILVTIGADKDASAVLFEKDGGVDLINYLCKRCLNAVRRLVSEIRNSLLLETPIKTASSRWHRSHCRIDYTYTVSECNI